MKATITLEDKENSDGLCISINFHGPINTLSDAHVIAINVVKSLKADQEEEEEDDE